MNWVNVDLMERVKFLEEGPRLLESANGSEKEGNISQVVPRLTKPVILPRSTTKYQEFLETGG